MTLFFPDVNVWLALSIANHAHSEVAWTWLESQPEDTQVVFSRYTQLGLLRLLTNASVTGNQGLTLGQAWAVYDGWMQDPRVEFYPEPRTIDLEFRQAMEPFAGKPASKWVGDCWLLAFAAAAGAELVTFDRALFDFGRKWGQAVVMPR
ncbi:MAG: TA system VapC family ribonuclease toxin [Acidobacteriaceae bacterium]